MRYGKSRSMVMIAPAPDPPGAGFLLAARPHPPTSLTPREFAMRTRYITYSDAIAQRICDELDSGRSLEAICRDDGMPCVATVHRWARLDLHGFGARYQRSRPPKGGPLIYSPAVAERICDQLRTGRTLADICDDEGMPSDSAVLHWTKVDRDGFRARYRQAREIGYMAMADEIIAIADDASNDWMARRERAPGPDGEGERRLPERESVERSRLRITARCWLLSRMLPRLFGDRLGIEATHEAGDSLRELMRIIDGRSRGLPAAEQAAAPDHDGAPRRCPSCGKLAL
jgi:hypothetical protein